MSAYKNLINSFFRGTGTGTEVDPFLPAMNHATLTIGHGSQTVSSPGSAVALTPSSTPAKWVTLQAYRANQNTVSIGGVGVKGATNGTGISLEPGDAFTIPVFDLSSVFVDALVTGDGVRFIYGN